MKKVKILIIEDHPTMIWLCEEIALDYLDNFDITIINPQEKTLEDILLNIKTNNYDYLFLDHDYKMNFTGKDIAEKSNFTGFIYSISGEKIDVEYCERYIGKKSLVNFFEELNQSISCKIAK